MTPDVQADRCRGEQSLLEALRQRVIACLPAEAMFQQIFDVARRYPDVNSDEQTG